MKRRTLLGGLAVSIGSLVGASLFGLLGYISSVSGDEPMLSPGEETTLSLKAWVVRSLRFERVPDEETMAFETSDAEIDPQTDAVAESYPPIWYWLPPRLHVTIDVPIRVSSAATPGEYQYAVSLSPTEDITSNVTTEEFTITVVEE